MNWKSKDDNMYETTICQVTAENQPSKKFKNTLVAPRFSSPPNSPLVGLIFDPSCTNNPNQEIMCSQRTNEEFLQYWTGNQDPIGTGAKKKTQATEKYYSAEFRTDHNKYNYTKEYSKRDEIFTFESSSFDTLVDGERMVMELCSETESRKENLLEEENNNLLPTEMQIVQLALQACFDAENIAISHQNRPCFKNIHSICAKARFTIQKPDSAVANLHSQGIPWVVKSLIFSFVRIVDGWKGMKELLNEKYDTFSRIEREYYSPNIRECFMQWQAITKEMLTSMFNTFKCLDIGYAMEQKHLSHGSHSTNYYVQKRSKFQCTASYVTNTPGIVNYLPPKLNDIQPSWVQCQNQMSSQSHDKGAWKSIIGYDFFKNQTAQNDHHSEHQNNIKENYKNNPEKCNPVSIQDTTAYISYTPSLSDFQPLKLVSNINQRKLCTPNDNGAAAAGQGNLSWNLLPPKEKPLRPNNHFYNLSETKTNYVQENNYSGNRRPINDFLSARGQMYPKQNNEYITYHGNSGIKLDKGTIFENISDPAYSNNIGNDQFLEMTKVYMKPGSYRVPIKKEKLKSTLSPTASHKSIFGTSNVNDLSTSDTKITNNQWHSDSLQKYVLESWNSISMHVKSSKVTTSKLTDCVLENECSVTDYPENLKQNETGFDYITGPNKIMPKDSGSFKNINNSLNEDRISRDVIIKKENTSVSYNCSKTHTKIKFFEEYRVFDDADQICGITESNSNSNIDDVEISCKTQLDIDNERKCKHKVDEFKMSYHANKKKYLHAATVKKFEKILNRFSQMAESNFLQQDMDIKMAPRFYEIIKYPLCLHDISIKLKNKNYTEYEQVLHDFKRIFKNIRLYLKKYPDAVMKANLNIVSNEFEKMLNDTDT